MGLWACEAPLECDPESGGREILLWLFTFVRTDVEITLRMFSNQH